MEKLRQCEDGLRQLNSWLSQVEQNLANLGPVREQIEELKRQISQAQVFLVFYII
jgi:cell shape-determining protein MreC